MKIYLSVLLVNLCSLIKSIDTSTATLNSNQWMIRTIQSQLESPEIGHFTMLSATQPITRFTPSIGFKSIASEQQPFNIVRFTPSIAQKARVSTAQSVPIQQTTEPTTSSCDPNPCLNGGVCDLAGTSFHCRCPWGFSGLRCEICTTDCASNPCPANKKCKAHFGGGFECVCPPNFSGFNCEIKNDICSSQPCLNGGVCRALEGGNFHCECARPWDGTFCEKIFQNPCTAEVLRETEIFQFRNPWDRTDYLICVDINTYHVMPCSTGTFFNERISHCVPEGYDPPSCPTNFCANSGLCVPATNSTAVVSGPFSCVCRAGFTGDRCQTNIDECVLTGNAACAGGTCIDQVNGYFCTCPSNNGIGLNCRDTIRNPCTLANLQLDRHYFDLPSPGSNVYLHCAGEFQFTVNKCAESLFWHSDEQTCSVERAPLRSAEIVDGCSAFSCRNGGECSQSADVNSVVFCMCKPGFTGFNCEIEINNCESDPCQNGGVCLSHPGGYNCLCQDKIVDDCCCNGILNPCPEKASSSVVDTFFPHFFPNRYIQCDHEGRAFVKMCSPKTIWNQDILGCLPAAVSNNVKIPERMSTGVVAQPFGFNSVASQQIQIQPPAATQPSPRIAGSVNLKMTPDIMIKVLKSGAKLPESLIKTLSTKWSF